MTITPINQLVQARQELINIINIFPSDKREQILFDKWSLKDLIAHLAGWDVFTVDCIETFKKGEFLKWGKGIDDFNKDSVNQRKNCTWQQVYGEFVTFSQKTIGEYRSLSPDQMVKRIWQNKMWTPEKFLKIDIDHYQEHLEQIKEKL